MYSEEPTEVTLTIESLEIAYDDEKKEEHRDARICPAKCFLKGSKLYLQYEEETEEDQHTKTMLVITQEELVIRRKGAMESRMQFRRGLSYSFLYHTPYGDVPLTIVTKELISEITEEKIKIHLAYDILSQETVINFHEIRLEAKK